MPIVWNREVESYVVEVFSGSTLPYTRSLRVKLKATDSLPAHTVSLSFPVSPPADYIDISTTFTTIQLALSQFEDVYRLLQTEKPIFFTAYEYDTLRFAGFTTDPEATGEGFRDSDAGPAMTSMAG